MVVAVGTSYAACAVGYAVCVVCAVGRYLNCGGCCGVCCATGACCNGGRIGVCFVRVWWHAMQCTHAMLLIHAAMASAAHATCEHCSTEFQCQNFLSHVLLMRRVYRAVLDLRSWVLSVETDCQLLQLGVPCGGRSDYNWMCYVCNASCASVEVTASL